MPDLSYRAEKARIRTEVLAHRRSAPPEVRAAADARLLVQLSLLVRENGARTVASYTPMNLEPGGAELPAALAATGARVLLPVLRADLDLDWAVYTGPDGLVRAPRGLREPVGPRLGVAAMRRADLVVAPAVAVDVRGVRLGRGGGSYDRALARVGEATLVVALLYDGELVDELPAEPHDRRVGAVITPGLGRVDLPTSAGRAAGP